MHLKGGRINRSIDLHMTDRLIDRSHAHPRQPTLHPTSFGGLFLGDVELLRTTTPEPSPQGISWHVEKDVSDYMTYILDGARPKVATLSIPNVIDGTYTGVLYVNATLSFYGRAPATSTSTSTAAVEGKEQDEQPANADADAAAAITKLLRGPGSGSNAGQGGAGALDGLTTLVPEVGARPPLILPLAAPSMPMMKLLRLNKSGGGSSFWASMAVSGDDAIEVPLPVWPQPNIARVHLDLFASPHQCEEVSFARAGAGPCVGGNVVGVRRPLLGAGMDGSMTSERPLA
jgi:hypothetical protein